MPHNSIIQHNNTQHTTHNTTQIRNFRKKCVLPIPAGAQLWYLCDQTIVDDRTLQQLLALPANNETKPLVKQMLDVNPSSCFQSHQILRESGCTLDFKDSCGCHRDCQSNERLNLHRRNLTKV
jgi:hypothetical protein